MKYQNVNPLEKLHPGEPWFFIRAQDIHAAATIQSYASMLNASGDTKGAREVYAIAGTVSQWQIANPDKVKLPD